MSGFWDVISLCLVIAGIGYMVCLVLTLKKVREEKIKKEQMSNIYAYIIIIAIMYILFWLVKINQ